MSILGGITSSISDITNGVKDVFNGNEGQGFSELLTGASTFTPMGEEKTLATSVGESAITSNDSNQ